MLNFQSLETVSRTTLLGIRFWDAAVNSQILEGLNVTLYPADNTHKKVQARCTKSCIYAFNRIPGMTEYESRSIAENESVSSPPFTKTFVLEVNDSRDRYTSVALPVVLPLPYTGLFLRGDSNGSPAGRPPGFNLYSSINRTPTTQYTFVRGQLIDRNTESAAAHALVQVETEDGFRWHGISDQQGQFSVMMPYPFLSLSFNSSPPSGDGVRFFQRTWPIGLSVFYEPLAQNSLPGTHVPDYSSVLNQAQASIYTEAPEGDTAQVSVLQTDLIYGRDLIVKTTGFSELYTSPTGSPA